MKFQLFFEVVETRQSQRNPRRKKIRPMMKPSVVGLEQLIRVALLCKLTTIFDRANRMKKASAHTFVSSSFFFKKKKPCIREEKDDINQSIESTPQTTPVPTNTSAPSQTPNNEQQPEIDEDGYCIQPKDPLWNAWAKKGISKPAFKVNLTW